MLLTNPGNPSDKEIIPCTAGNSLGSVIADLALCAKLCLQCLAEVLDSTLNIVLLEEVSESVLVLDRFELVL